MIENIAITLSDLDQGSTMPFNNTTKNALGLSVPIYGHTIEVVRGRFHYVNTPSL